LRGKRSEVLVSQIVSDLQGVLRLASGDRSLQALGKVYRNGKLEIDGFSYRVRKLAPEFKDGETMNVEHHLALVFRLGSAVAIHLSESQHTHHVPSEKRFPFSWATLRDLAEKLC
jgi:hypothetical protein